MSVEKNKSCSICFVNRTDPAKYWKLSNKYDFIRISVIDQDDICLGDDSPSDAIAGRVDADDDPQTAHELLGI